MNTSLLPFIIRILLQFPLISPFMSNYAFAFCKILQMYDSQPPHPNSPHFPLGHLTIHSLCLAICRFQSNFIIYIFSIYHNTTHACTSTEGHDSSFPCLINLIWPDGLLLHRTGLGQCFETAVFGFSQNPSFPWLSSSHSPKVPKTLTIPKLSRTTMALNPGLQPEGINLSPPSLTSSYSTKEHICSVS